MKLLHKCDGKLVGERWSTKLLCWLFCIVYMQQRLGLVNRVIGGLSPLVPKKRFGDKVRQGLNIFSIDEKTWYTLVHDRQSSLLKCTRGISAVLLQLHDNMLVYNVYMTRYCKAQL